MLFINQPDGGMEIRFSDEAEEKRLLDILRPHGEWIFDEPTGYWYCSNCEREPKDQDYMLPFCAWCGSDNRQKEGEAE